MCVWPVREWTRRNTYTSALCDVTKGPIAFTSVPVSMNVLVSMPRGNSNQDCQSIFPPWRSAFVGINYFHYFPFASYFVFGMCGWWWNSPLHRHLASSPTLHSYVAKATTNRWVGAHLQQCNWCQHTTLNSVTEMEQETMVSGGVTHSYLKLLVHVNENMHSGCVLWHSVQHVCSHGRWRGAHRFCLTTNLHEVLMTFSGFC